MLNRKIFCTLINKTIIHWFSLFIIEAVTKNCICILNHHVSVHGETVWMM